MLAHVLQVVGWWVAPLVIFLVRRQSRFVAFHALQAFLLQILYMIFSVLCMVSWLVGFFVMAAHSSRVPGATPSAAMFLVFPMLWLGWMAVWLLILIVAIVYGIKAGRGEWAEYPLVGRLSRKFLDIGPGGSVIPSEGQL